MWIGTVGLNVMVNGLSAKNDFNEPQNRAVLNKKHIYEPLLEHTEVANCLILSTSK